MLIQPLPLHTISTQLTRHEVFRLAWNTALPDGHSSATWGPSAASPVHAWAGGNTLLGPLHKPLANKLHTRRVLGPRHSGAGPPASAAHALAVTVGAVSGAAAAAALGGPSPHPSLSNHALIVLERAEHSGPAGLACVTVNHSTHKPGPDTTECAEWHAGFAGLGCTGAPILLAVHAQRQALDALGCMRWTLQCQALTRDASLAAAVFGVVEAAWASIPALLIAGLLSQAFPWTRAIQAKLHLLDADLYPDAVCMDGSQSGYYFQPALNASDATKWIVHLQGGGECTTKHLCDERIGTPLFSSKYWAEEQGLGFYNYVNATANPAFWSWNHVQVE
ncbi:PAE7, partial [Symbiodinium sp. KB8]